jgi:putative endonuclease
VTKSARNRHEHVLTRHIRPPTVAVMSTDLRHRLGRAGEDAALRHLERRGCELVARNHRTRFGEIDLIVRDDRTLVFCEVKTRRSGGGSPWDALGAPKQRQVRQMAVAYLSEVADRPNTSELRFDAIGVVFDARGRLVRIDHIEAAF